MNFKKTFNHRHKCDYCGKVRLCQKISYFYNDHNRYLCQECDQKRCARCKIILSNTRRLGRSKKLWGAYKEPFIIGKTICLDCEDTTLSKKEREELIDKLLNAERIEDLLNIN